MRKLAILAAMILATSAQPAHAKKLKFYPKTFAYHALFPMRVVAFSTCFFVESVIQAGRNGGYAADREDTGR